MTRSICFDPLSGRLHLTSGAFLALASVAVDRSVPQDQVDALSRAGVLVDGALHRALAPALGAVTSPTAQLSVAVMEDAGCFVHQGWLSEVSGVLEDLGEDMYDLLTVDTGSMPATIARLAGLTHRPTLEVGEVKVTEDQLDDLAAADPGARRRASVAIAAATPHVWTDWARHMWAGEWRFIVVDVFWPNSSGGLTDRRIAVLDTAAGLTLVDASGSDMRLVPATPRVVWRLMLGLLPRASEVHVH